LLKAEHLEELLAGKKPSLPELSSVYKGVDSELDRVANQEPALFEVSIRAEKRADNGRGANSMWTTFPDGAGFDGEIATVESALHHVFQRSDSRMVVKGKLPDGFYNFRLRAPKGKNIDLENQFINALRITFNLEVNRINRMLDAYTLTVVRTNAAGLQPAGESGGGGGTQGGFRIKGASMDTVVEFLEEAVGRPIFDESKLKGPFTVDMKWEMSASELLPKRIDRRVWAALERNPNTDLLNSLPKDLVQGDSLNDIKLLMAELAKPEGQQFRPNPDSVVKAARERLGLELKPIRRSVEVLEVQVLNGSEQIR